MRVFQILSLVLLGLIAFSIQQNQYNVEFDDTAYFVRETDICVNKKTYTCVGNEFTEHTHKNADCTDESFNQKTVTCKGKCKCTDDHPTGQQFTFYEDDKCTKLDNIIVSVAKVDSCFRFKKAEKKVYTISSVDDTTFVLKKYPDEGCGGPENIVLEGKYGTCTKYPGTNTFVKVENTGDFSESSSFGLEISYLAIIAVSFILIFFN